MRLTVSLFRSPPSQEYILANTSSSSKARSIPWGKLLSRKEVWALIVCHFCHNWGTFILLSWMPTYYNQVSRASRALAAAAAQVLCQLPV